MRGFNDFLANRSIRARINYGFGALIAVFGLTSVYNFYTVDDLGSQFAGYYRVSRDVRQIVEIDNYVIELQRQILLYRQNENIGSASRISELYQLLIERVDEMRGAELFKEQANENILAQFQTSLHSLGDNLDSLLTTKQHRDRRTSELKTLFADLYLEISEFSDNLERAGQPVPTEIRGLYINLSRADTLSADYLLNHDVRLKDEVRRHIATARLVGKKYVATAADGEAIVVSRINKKLNELQPAFFKMVQADRYFSFLTNVVLTGITSELIKLSDLVKTNAIQSQSQIYAASNEAFQRNRTISVVSLCAALGISLLLSVQIARSIVRPLQSITDTFKRLSAGAALDEIPGLNRRDEIGEMAASANIFREKNAETELLLATTEKLADNLKRNEEKLKRSNAELDSFTYIASHDLKSPLRAIDNLASWIEEDCADILPAESQTHFKKLRARIVRMENLLADMLIYSRAGRTQAQIREVRLSEVINDARELVDHPPDFEFDFAGPDVTLQTHAALLAQVFQNLFSNAVKYSDKRPGRVSIEVSDAGNGLLEIAVKDNGPGIKPEFHTRIFEMFQTLQSRDVIESSGIGLALVKKVVENEGGSIEVRSDIGQGAAFIFTWHRWIDTETEDAAAPLACAAGAR